MTDISAFLGQILGALLAPIPLVAGVSTSFAEIVGFASGAACVALAARASVWTWPIGNLTSASWLILFLGSGLYADSVLQVVYLAMGFYGWWHWLRGGERATERPIEHASRREHRGNVGDGVRLPRQRPGQAMQDEVERGRLEPAGDRERLEHVGLDHPDVEVSQAMARMAQHRRIRVEQRHGAARGQAAPGDEVAGPGADIQVNPTDVLAIVVQQPFRRATPDEPCDRPQHEGVVAGEQQRVVVALPSPRRIGGVHG